MPPSSPPIPLTSRIVCAVLLLGALLVLRESSSDESSSSSRWAVWVALRQHPPSLRIFRSLLEWNLLVWCTAVSLQLWYTYVGADMVADLLFASSDGGHCDAGDGGGKYFNWAGSFDGNNNNADDDDGRKRTYLQVQQQDDDMDASSILFSDPHTSFSQLMTGTEEENPLDLFPHHQKAPPFRDDPSSTVQDDEPGNNDNAIAPDSGTQQQQESQPQYETEDAHEEEEEATSSPAASSFDAQGLSHAPSVASVVGAALDMLLPIFISLFLFTLSSTQETARLNPRLSWLAPLIPLLLVAYLTVTQLVRPWKARKHFAIVVGWTMGAPLFPVTFRDGFIGDIFTSTVRPLQDAAFTVCYILSGFQGYWSDGYAGFWDSVNHNPHGLNDDDDAAMAAAAEAPTEAPFSTHSMLPPLETSWWLHTFLLPMCMVSPLWWRFLQNLRQTHDNRMRWPYLGNAFKYLLAAEVAMFGVFDPSKQETFVWLGSFVLATLYQVWWDVFMDWELLVLNTQRETSSWWSWCNYYRFRENRLYPSKSFYMGIFLINFVLRFCWTLSFLPPRYLNQAGVLSDNFQHSDWSRALAPAIASAEILRRTLWGFIRLENEAINVQKEQENFMLPPAAILELQYRGRQTQENYGDMLDGMEPMGVSRGGGGTSQRWSFSRRQGIIPALIENLKTLEHSNEFQILAELSLWATVFTVLGMIAAAHRMTL